MISALSKPSFDQPTLTTCLASDENRDQCSTITNNWSGTAVHVIELDGIVRGVLVDASGRGKGKTDV